MCTTPPGLTLNSTVLVCSADVPTRTEAESTASTNRKEQFKKAALTPVAISSSSAANGGLKGDSSYPAVRRLPVTTRRVTRRRPEIELDMKDAVV